MAASTSGNRLPPAWKRDGAALLNRAAEDGERGGLGPLRHKVSGEVPNMVAVLGLPCGPA